MIKMQQLSTADVKTFNTDGFLIVDKVLDTACLNDLHAAYEDLFYGRFETGTMPDEVNWQYATGDPGLTRQICNGWKANRLIADIVLDSCLAEAVASLSGWSGVRIMIDNVLWKPPQAKSLGYHQDSAYLDWFTPSDLLTCWIALDDTSANGGTMELARSSHRWRLSEPSGQFHAPDDYKKPMLAAALEAGVTPDVVAVEVPAGGGSFHHGRTWHGSGQNCSTKPRRALVLHAMRADVAYVPENFHRGIGPIYSRYRQLQNNQLDENHFPILWREGGYRTPGI